RPQRRPPHEIWGPQEGRRLRILRHEPRNDPLAAVFAFYSSLQPPPSSLPMQVNDLAKLLGDACYIFLTLSFLWGLYCIIMVTRRLRALAFKTELEQAEFLTELQQRLRSQQ